MQIFFRTKNNILSFLVFQGLHVCDFQEVEGSKDLPNMNTFCDWLFETIVISAYDSFFRNYISIVLLSFIVCSSQSQRLFIWVGGDLWEGVLF